jgi:capsular exopolysaccharide synthesis family protein
MGKVYDALNRAEEQRRRGMAGAAPGAVSPAPVGPSADWSAAPDKPRAGGAGWRFWERWTSRRTASIDDPNAVNKRRIALLMPDSFVAEQFRTLRARIDSLTAQRPIRTLAMTSALSGEGKTTTACNFALVMSMSVDRRVLFVDTDMRKPKAHRALGLRIESGLAEVLQGQAELDKAIVRVEGTNLDALAVRAQPPNPAELLASPRMKELVEEVGRRYDLVIFDTPATLGLPDAKTVSELVDGLVMVVRADIAPRADVMEALDVLDRRRVLGLVLNGAAIDEKYYGY